MADEYIEESEDVVEKAKADKAARGNVFARIILFFQQVVGELRKVTRPTWKELLNYTAVVMAFVTVVMLIITFLDWIFLLLVTWMFSSK